MGTRTVSASRVIAAPPERIFEVLADPEQHAAIDGSGSVHGTRKGAPARLKLGSRFGMHMRIGAPYLISNKVVEFHEGRRIAWRHYGRHVWRYELEAVEGGTRVTETFDWGPSPIGPVLVGLGVPERNRVNMEKTLERLEEHVTR